MLIFLIFLVILLVGIITWLLVYFFDYTSSKKKLENIFNKYRDYNLHQVELDRARIFRISEHNMKYQNLFWEVDDILTEINAELGSINTDIYDYEAATKNKKITKKEIKQEIKKITEKTVKFHDLIDKFSEKSKDVIDNVDSLWKEFERYDIKTSLLVDLYEEQKEKYKDWEKHINNIIENIGVYKDEFRLNAQKVKRKEALESIFNFREKIIELANIIRYSINFKLLIHEKLPNEVSDLRTKLKKELENGISINNINSENSLTKFDDLFLQAKKSLKNSDIFKSKEYIFTIIKTIQNLYYDLNKEKMSSIFLQKYFSYIPKIIEKVKKDYTRARNETIKLEKEKKLDNKWNLKKISLINLISHYVENTSLNFSEIKELFIELEENISCVRKVYLIKKILLLLKSIEVNTNQILKINFQNSDLAQSNKKYFQNLEKIYIDNIYEAKNLGIVLQDHDIKQRENIENYKNSFIDTLNISSNKKDYDNLSKRVDNFFFHINKLKKDLNLKLIKVFIIDEIIQKIAIKRSQNLKFNKLAIILEKYRLEGEYEEALNTIISFFKEMNIKENIN